MIDYAIFAFLNNKKPFLKKYFKPMNHVILSNSVMMNFLFKEINFYNVLFNNINVND